MHTQRKPRWRPAGVGLAIAILAGAIIASAAAGTIRGTPRNDTERGTSAADKLYGNAGNDRLFGLAGNDYLNGGPGNDVLTGGPGADVLVCGPGHDTAVADAADKVAADCETVQGLPKPAASVSGGSLAEGNDGSQPLSFTVTLAKASSQRVSVAYATADGTATAGSDYTAANGTLVFAAGETSKTVAVAVTGDTAGEPDETFTLTLSKPVNATLGQSTATGTVTNDDPSPRAGHYAGTTSQGKELSFDVGADMRSLSNLTFTLTCRGGVDVPISFGDTFTLGETGGWSVIFRNGGDFGFVSGSFDPAGHASGRASLSGACGPAP